MPSVKTPDGRTLRFPEGTSNEQVMEVLRQQFPDSFQTPIPAPQPAPVPAPQPAPVPAAPGASPGAAPAPVAAPVPAPAPAAPGAPDAAPWAAGNPEYDRELARVRAEEVESMGIGGRMLAGAGQSVASNARGIRQLWNYLQGDKEELAKLQEEEAESRRLDAPLLDTASGRTGQIAGHIAQLAVPGSAVSKGVKAATLAAPRAAQLAAVLGAESALGAGSGATQPTIEGESRGRNAAVGGALGIGARAVPGAARAVGSILSAKTGVPTLVAAAARALRGGKAALDPAKEAVRRQAGEKIDEITRSIKVPLSSISRELDAVRSAYGSDLPASVRAQLKALSQMGKMGGQMKGEKVQEMKVAIAREASESGGIKQTGLERLSRVLDKAVDDAIPKSRARALRQARTEYRTGRAQPKVGALAPTVISIDRSVGGE